MHCHISARLLFVAIMGKTYFIQNPQLEKETICFAIERSLNRNVVIYEGLIDKATGKLRKDKPMDVYWLDLDPAYVEKNRKNGKMHDRDELNYIEKTMAYGISCTPVPGREDEYTLTLVALPSKKCTLKIVDGIPKTVVDINGKQCYMENIYVETQAGWTGLPRVMYVLVKGVTVDGGEPQEEKING